MTYLSSGDDDEVSLLHFDTKVENHVCDPMQLTDEALGLNEPTLGELTKGAGDDDVQGQTEDSPPLDAGVHAIDSVDRVDPCASETASESPMSPETFFLRIASAAPQIDSKEWFGLQVAVFCQQCCEISSLDDSECGTGPTVRSKTLFRKFSQWSAQLGVTIAENKEKTFNKKLVIIRSAIRKVPSRIQILKPQRCNEGRIFRGIKLKSDTGV
jgi:hypothetical protein